MWQKLLKILDTKGKTVYWLANATDIPETTLRNWGKDHDPTFKNICKVADVLHISLDDLRGNKNE